LGGGQEAEYYRHKGGVVRKDEDGNLRIVSERLAVPARDNRLMFEGEAIRPLHYTEDIVAGFKAAYDALLSRTAELTDENLIPADCVVRYIPLDTATYGKILQQSLHPDFTRRTVHRELVAASLAYRAPYVDWVKRLLPAEITALVEGDIPKFVARVNDTAIAGHNVSLIDDFLRQTPLSMLGEKIAALSEVDRDKQVGIIRLAMATLCKIGDTGSEMHPQQTPGDEELPAAEYLVEVDEIGQMICNKAIWADGVPDWVIITQGENGRSALLPAGLDIYDGVAGIGIFMLEAGKRLGKAQFLDLGRSCGKRLQTAMGIEQRRIGGAYNGAASNAWALFRLGQGFAEPSWCDSASMELVRLAGLIEKDRMFDLIGGSAGYAAVALDVFRATGEAGLRDAAIKAGEFMITKRVACEIGHALPPRHGDRPLTGFSHGAAGMGFALLHIGAEFGHNDLISAGYSAFDYEDSQFDPVIHGYPDLREIVAKDRHSDSGAWCHGAPGIALSRIAMPYHLRRPQDRKTIADRITRAVTEPLAPNDSVCHGEIGNTEILITAAQADGNPALAAKARKRISSAILRKREQGAWRCGAVPRVFIPGAMIGMAGIGLGLLRANDPGGVRSILVPC
ncbi:MAG: hypothetical protein RL367_294, partial [Pseudomonadota bacterium]